MSRLNLFRQLSAPLHIFLVVLLVASFFARFDVDLHHDGLVFKPALDVVQGKVLYQDTYTLYGGLTVLIQALAVWVVGPYVIAVRLVTALIYALTAVLLWRIWSVFLSPGWSMVSLGMWVGLSPYFIEPFYPWSSVYATFLVVLLLERFISWSRPTSSQPSQFLFWQLMIMGSIAGLAFLVKQPYIIVLGSLTGYFLVLGYLTGWKWSVTLQKIGWLWLGFIIPVASFIGWVIIQGAWQDFWLQTVRVGYIYGKILGISFTRHDFLVSNGIWLLLLLVPVGLLIISAGRWRQRPRDQVAAQLLGVGVIIAASMMHYFPVFDHSHAYWAATPAIGLAIYLGLRWFNHTHRMGVKMMLLAGLSLVSISVLQGVMAGLVKASQDCVQLIHPTVLRGLCLSPTDASYLTDVTATIDDYLLAHPDKVLVMNTENPLYVTFTSAVFYPPPVFFNNSGYTSGIYPFEDQLKQYIDEYQPLVMVTPGNINWIDGYTQLKQWPDWEIVLLQPD